MLVIHVLALARQYNAYIYRYISGRTRFQTTIDWLHDWVVINAKISSISTISWRSNKQPYQVILVLKTYLYKLYA
jgi:hypothetical protein